MCDEFCNNKDNNDNKNNSGRFKLEIQPQAGFEYKVRKSLDESQTQLAKQLTPEQAAPQATLPTFGQASLGIHFRF